MSRKQKTAVVLACCLFAAGTLWGQGAVGTINGTVLDSAGAVVPGAPVTVINANTGVDTKTTTTSAGAYTLPYLPEGTYTIRVSASGFRTSTATNVVLRAAQTLTVNINLEVGQLSEQVTVSATPPLLESGTAEIGRYINKEEFGNWPIFTSDGQRQIQQFIFDSLPGATGSTWQGSINGGQQFSHEIMIEGLPLGRADISGGNNNEMSPSIDAIGDFKLQTGAVSAEYNGGQTAIANFSIKSGTNELHGSGFEYLQNEAFNAEGLGSSGTKAKYRDNNWGFSLGGPVYIPKIYDGRNRTFFFTNFEKDNRNQLGFSGYTTLAPNAYRSGDFSRLFNSSWTGQSGISGQIYDPTTTRIENGVEVRDPFPGNVIPSSRIDSVASNIVNKVGLTPAAFDTMLANMPSLSTGQPYFREHIIGVKVDHNISDTERFSAYYNHGFRDRNNSSGGAYLPVPGLPTTGWRDQATPSRMVRTSLTSTLTPTFINRLAAGFNRFGNSSGAPVYTVGKDWAGQIGIKNTSDSVFPKFAFSGADWQGGTINQFGVGSAGYSANGSWIVNDDATKILGKHTIHFGYQYTRYYYNERNLSGSGVFNFSPNQTALPGATSTTGNAFASFLLGAVDHASNTINDLSTGFRAPYHATWIHDDFKVTPKLTLTLGLRWEIITPFSERTGRMSYIDLSGQNPSAGNKNGVIKFANAPSDTYFRQVLPRFGIAYQASNKMVVRTGYAILSTSPTTNAWGYGGFTTGYNANINVTAGTSSTGFADDPAMYLSTPFPSLGYSLPNKDAANANFNAGMTTAPDANRPGYVQNYNLSVQYEMSKSTVLEVAYVGNKGTRVWGFNSVNVLPASMLSMGDKLRQPVSQNTDLIPYSGFPTSLSVAQALLPYPMFYGINEMYAYNTTSNYNSVQVTATKHLAKGLGFLASYTWSKTIDYQDSNGATGYGVPQDYYNRGLERSVAGFNRPHVFKLTWSYDLPIGKGKSLDLHWANYVVGGWTLSGIHNYQSGTPISVGQSGLNTPTGFGSIRPDVTGAAYTLGDLPEGDNTVGTQWLNPAAFASVPMTGDGVPLRVGTAPRTIPQLYSPRSMSEKLRMAKDFPLYRERCKLKLGATWDNPGKRTELYLVDATVGNSQFGQVKRRGGSRTMQIDARIEF